MRHAIRSMLVIMACLLAQPTLADPHPAGFRNHKFNPVNPVTKNGVTTFHIDNHKCSNVKYGDGRGESDCYNGNVRSVLAPPGHERLGETIEYSFDLWVDPSINYAGWSNDHALGYIPGLRDTRLRIASWEGQYLHNFLYMVKLDSVFGVRFLSKSCFPKEEFGQWNHFSMKIKWAADKRGWIKVACNDRIVWLAENIATNQGPECYITNQCEPDKKKNPNKFLFIPGPVLAGFGHEWKKYGKPSPFTEIGPDGVTIKMRNLSVKRGAKLYQAEDIERVKTLQSHLVKLGCDPGPADGIYGAKTRETARTCREFDTNVLPFQFDIATLPKVLAAYREHYPVD